MVGPFGWGYYGQERPPYAEATKDGEESVWDYPRPPKLVQDTRRVIVRAGGKVVADTTRALRLLETASPPTFYIPRDDVDMEMLKAAGGGSVCEWKGNAVYWDVADVKRAAWGYPSSKAPYERLRDCVAFYPDVLRCTVDSEVVRRQDGQFYGGWVTNEIKGPRKGASGTMGW